METKLATLKKHWTAGNRPAALKLAASWGRRGLGGAAHADAITKGWAAYSNREFYVAIGADPDALVAAAYLALQERYGLT